VTVSDSERRAADHLLAGEYGATRIVVVKDGLCVRIAFGRNGIDGPIFTGAVMLSPEALESLKEQIRDL